jgi:hypothetical protein
MNTIGWLESIWQDLRYGARLLRLSPGFAAWPSLRWRWESAPIRRFFNCSMPCACAACRSGTRRRLAEVKIVGGNHGMGLNQQYGELTRPIWQLIREQAAVLLGDVRLERKPEVRGPGQPDAHFKGLWVSGDFFRVLGVRPWRGRLLMPEDEGACPVTHAVVSYSYWQSQTGRPRTGGPASSW